MLWEKGAASMIFSSWVARSRKEGRLLGLGSQQASIRPRHSGSHQPGTSGARLPTIRPASAHQAHPLQLQGKKREAPRAEGRIHYDDAVSYRAFRAMHRVKRSAKP